MSAQTKLFYENYLRSDHWKEVKNRYFSRNERQCCVCGSTISVDLHHLRYKKRNKSILNRELDHWLAPLCRRCHTTWHRVAGAYGLDKSSMKKWLNKWKKGIPKCGYELSLIRVCRSKCRTLSKYDWMNRLKSEYGTFYMERFLAERQFWHDQFSKIDKNALSSLGYCISEDKKRLEKLPLDNLKSKVLSSVTVC